MRVVQPEGQRGSLKWIQKAVNERWPALDGPILRHTGGSRLDWVSPLDHDGFAEYRDDSFLERIGFSHLQRELAAFWPRHGPQWDALGVVDGCKPVLVEAKSHIAEFCTPGTTASEVSRAKIEASLLLVAEKLGAKPKAPWADCFYQLANRLAMLSFLRDHGVDAYLALVGFVGDVEMAGPATAEGWSSAYTVANHVLGLPKRHALSKYMVEVNPVVPNV